MKKARILLLRGVLIMMLGTLTIEEHLSCQLSGEIATIGVFLAIGYWIEELFAPPNSKN